MRAQRGYSLIEIGLAVCVISVGVLGILGAFSFSLRSVDHARYISQALNVGRQLTEQVRTYNLPDWSTTWPTSDASGLFDAPTDRRAVNAAPFDTVSPQDNFTRNVLLERLSTDPSDYHYTMAKITVKVYWKEGAVEKSVTLQSVYKQP